MRQHSQFLGGPAVQDEGEMIRATKQKVMKELRFVRFVWMALRFQINLTIRRIQKRPLRPGDIVWSDLFGYVRLRGLRDWQKEHGLGKDDTPLKVLLSRLDQGDRR